MGGGGAVVVVMAVVVLAVTAVAQEAPAPSSGAVNLTDILAKGGQFNRLIRMMTETQVAEQIENQLNSSTEGLTVLAPTDNAFDNLKAGLLNGLSTQDQVNLLQYHILTKFYTLDNLLTVSNPVRTQYSQDGLNFTGQSRQVNVSSGLSQTQLNNALRQSFPLAVYVTDVVLLPPSLFTAKPPSSAPPPPPRSNSTTGSNQTQAPSNDSAASSTALSAILSALLLALASMLA